MFSFTTAAGRWLLLLIANQYDSDRSVSFVWSKTVIWTFSRVRDRRTRVRIKIFLTRKTRKSIRYGRLTPESIIYGKLPGSGERNNSIPHVLPQAIHYVILFPNLIQVTNNDFISSLTNKLPNVRFEVFTAVTMKNDVVWDVAPCSFLYEPTFRRNVSPPSSGQRNPRVRNQREQVAGRPMSQSSD
jgi:hypothetical protein